MSGSTLDLADVNARLDTQSPQDILRWAWDTFAPDVVLTCSFQHDGVALAHMLRTVAPDVPIVFLDTGFHFCETLAYKDELVRRFGFPVREVKPIVPREEFATQYGLDLYKRNPDLCCHINKVEPLRLALQGVRAWINGRRRDQSATRHDLPVVEALRNGLHKVNPLAHWSSRDTYAYLQANDVPLHPLFEKGYASIGCEPCTRPVLPGEDERAGRWAGQAKTECGIHTFIEPAKT
jgi:phosphoadenosine phosphosulfate reductase